MEFMKNSVNNEVATTAVIVDIKPFNGYFLASCFIQSLLPILNKYDIPVEWILVHCVPYYKKHDSGLFEGHFCTDYLVMDDVDHLLSLFGVKVHSYRFVQNLFEFIFENIQKQEPIICFVDGFYLPYRTDIYRTSHLEHAVLIYGIDIARKVIFLIDHSELNTLDFKKLEIAYESLQEAFLSYVLARFEKRDKIFRFCFQHVNRPPISLHEIYLRYIINYRQNDALIIDGLEKLKEYVNEFKGIALDESRLEIEAQHMIQCLKYILKTKKQEYRLMQSLNAPIIHQKFCRDICQYWSDIMNIIQHYVFSRKYKENSIIRSVDSIFQVSELEEKLYQYVHTYDI